MPFAIEVVGFADEEGVRFASTLLGSRALAGTFDKSVLNTRDRDGVSMRDALICRGGISHHPDEHVELADAEAGARVLLRVIENFRPWEGKSSPQVTG